jgi:hypothetical protein
MLFTILVLLAILLVLRHSWGPAMHVWAGMETIKRLQSTQAPNRDQRTVLDHPDPFLYGMIAPDLINFKGFGGLRNHCHNWNMRDRMLPFLTTPDRRAFYLGYLCHLAADVSSHNYFVPYHRVAELPPRLLGHAFWENRADVQIEDRYWQILEDLRRTETFRAFDEIIDQAVEVKAFSLRSNRLIFHTLLLGQSRPVLRKARGILKQRSPVLTVNEGLLAFLKEKVVADLARLLAGSDWPAIVSMDPTGRIPLRAARALRRQLLAQYPSRDEALPVAKRLARDCFWPPAALGGPGA